MDSTGNWDDSEVTDLFSSDDTPEDVARYLFLEAERAGDAAQVRPARRR